MLLHFTNLTNSRKLWQIRPLSLRLPKMFFNTEIFAKNIFHALIPLRAKNFLLSAYKNNLVLLLF